MTSPSYNSFFEIRNYIAEVRLPVHDRLLQLYLVGSKGIS